MPPPIRDYSDHAKVLIMIQEAKDAEAERRSNAIETQEIITERGGLWGDYATRMADRFRGDFDLLTPIVDKIAGEIEANDFSLRFSPSGGLASKDTAKTLDGLTRNIRNTSHADDIINDAGRDNVECGFAAWEIVQDWLDGDSFDQDLFFRRIPDALSSVWIDPASVEPVPIDAGWGIKQKTMMMADYKEKWPKGGGISIGDTRTDRHNYTETPLDVVTVGQFYYLKSVSIDIVRMTDGSVYKDDDKFKALQDELAAENITIEVDSNGDEKRRKRNSWRCWSRMMDGGEWLDDGAETVFDYVPLPTVYGNFKIVNKKRVYYGKLENLLDAARVFNFSQSRAVEDNSFSPPEIFWMTKEQADGEDYSDLNTSRQPVRYYNNVPNTAPPTRTGGPNASTGIQSDLINMKEIINLSSGSFNADKGNAVSTQSGIAGLQQIEQASLGNIKWLTALERAVCYSGLLILGARSRVYDGTRDAQVLAADGTAKTVSLNKSKLDEQTQKNIVLNDMSLGDYSVVCEMGPAYKSAQKESARAFETMATINPELVAGNTDVWLANRSEPGMDIMAERERAKLFQAGVIPETQWTDEEKQQAAQAKAEAANQPQQPDPNMLIAQAEMGKAQAEQQNAQNKQVEIQGSQQLEAAKIELEHKKVDLETEKFLLLKDDKLNAEAVKLDQSQQKIDNDADKNDIAAQQNQQKIDMQADKQRLDEIVTQMATEREEMKLEMQRLNDSFANLKTMREAMGVDSIVGTGNTEAYIEQAEIVGDLQDQSEGESADVTVIATTEPAEENNEDDT